MLVSQNTCD